MITLPRNAQIWLPGLLRHSLAGRRRAPIETVWLIIADHYEPHWNRADLDTAKRRVAAWHDRWPRIAEAHLDDTGQPAQYTFFYPEEEYHPELLEPLAALTRRGVADVEVHIHHGGEGETWFVDHIGRYVETLRDRHGLLREHQGRPVFGFVHGNWALDNSDPSGAWCGLDNELTLLRQLGCYADFTMPAAPNPCQTSTVNSIYWAVDDPTRPKSHDVGARVEPGGTPPADGLLMVQGPLTLRWPSDRWPMPALEVGELAAQDPVTPDRVAAWLRAAPAVGGHLFVKLHAHGAPEKNAAPLLERDLEALFRGMRAACARRGWRLRYGTAWQAAQAIEGLVGGGGPRTGPVLAGKGIGQHEG